MPTGHTLAPRPVESYTSLERLIERPHEWVLEYPARLRPGRLADLPRGPLLYGRLAHRMLELYFAHHPDWARSRRAERRESGSHGPEIEAPGASSPASREFVWFSPSKGRTETTPTAAMPTTDGVDDWTLVSDPRTNPGS